MLPQLPGQPLPAVGSVCRGVWVGFAGAQRVAAHGSKRQWLELPGLPGVAVGVLVPAVAFEKERSAVAVGGRGERAGVEDQRDLVARCQDDRQVVRGGLGGRGVVLYVFADELVVRKKPPN